MATANQYHPWTETGETELDYFRRRFLEESGRAERLCQRIEAEAARLDRWAQEGSVDQRATRLAGAALLRSLAAEDAAAPSPPEPPPLPAEVQAVVEEHKVWAEYVGIAMHCALIGDTGAARQVLRNGEIELVERRLLSAPLEAVAALRARKDAERTGSREAAMADTCRFVCHLCGNVVEVPASQAKDGHWCVCRRPPSRMRPERESGSGSGEGGE